MGFEIEKGPLKTTSWQPSQWVESSLRIVATRTEGTLLIGRLEVEENRVVRIRKKRSREVDFQVNRTAALSSALNRADNDDAVKYLIIGSAGIPWVVSWIVDALSFGLSSLFVLPTGILASIDSWSNESATHSESRVSTWAMRELSVSFPGTDLDGKLIATGPVSEVSIDVGEEAIEVLSSGAASLGVRISDAKSGLGADWLVSRSALHEVGAAELGRRRGHALEAARLVLSSVEPRDRDSMRQLLAAQGYIFAASDDEAADLLAALGEDVPPETKIVVGDRLLDWSAQMPELAPRLLSSIEEVAAPEHRVAGSTLRLRVRLENAGKGSAYRVAASASLKIEALNAHAVSGEQALETLGVDPVVGKDSEASSVGRAVGLFGRIEPGQVIERVVAVPTPTTSDNARAEVRFTFSEANGFVAPPLRARAELARTASPRFAFSLRVVEDNSGTSSGNGDGAIQRGEAADIIVAAKNVGDAAASDVVLSVLVAEEPHLQVFGEHARDYQSIGSGEVVQHTVSLAVKPGFSGTEILLSINIAEGSSPMLQDTVLLSVDSRAPRRVIAVDYLIVTDRATPLLASASDDSRPLGRVDQGVVLRAVGELDAYVQVEYLASSGGGARAWLHRDAVSPSPSRTQEASPAGGLAGAVSPRSAVREFVNAPPLLALVSPEEGRETRVARSSVRLKAVAKDPDGIAHWRILCGGEVVAEAWSDTDRGIKPSAAEARSRGAPSVVISEMIPLSPGINIVTVEAVDALGERAEVKTTIERASRGARAVALVVGLNSYEDAAIPSLQYAEADAEAVARFLKSDKSLVRDPADVTLLIGPQATVRNIETAFERTLIQEATHPEDTAIFYFAGHGYTVGDKTYLVGRDTQLNALRATGLRASALAEYWSEIAAGTKILIADACHSGGIGSLRSGNRVMTEMAVKISGRGTVSFLASGPQQVSVESKALGHGVFTYSLLRGLEGEAADANGRVTAKALAAYLDQEVPTRARREGSYVQTPAFRAETEGSIFLTRLEP